MWYRRATQKLSRFVREFNTRIEVLKFHKYLHRHERKLCACVPTCELVRCSERDGDRALWLEYLCCVSSMTHT